MKGGDDPVHLLKILWGAALGGLLGIPVAVLVYFVARVLVLPTSTWSSDTVMWLVMAPVIALGALAGAARDMKAAWARRIFRMTAGFFMGFIGCAFLAAVAGVLLAGLFQVSQREGGFAMGLMFGIAPLAGLVGGIAAAIWAALDRSSEDTAEG